MAEGDVDALKIYWDHFFKAETGTYEKSTWLDLFLAEFLIRVNDGADAKELIKFCPVSGVVTLVGCELLCGIHRVTSSITAHYSPPPPLACLDPPPRPAHNTHAESDAKSEERRVSSCSVFGRANSQPSAEILRQYLLGGVAWRCLALLRVLGVEGLSCCRQLSSVLIWLFGELSGGGAPAPATTHTAAPAPAPALAPPPAPRKPIHQLFSHKIWSKQKPSIRTSKSHSVATSERCTGRSRHNSQYESPDKNKRKTLKHSEVSSESGDSNDDLQILNRSLAIKVCTPNDDFEYFNSSLRSSNDYPSTYTDSSYSPRKAKPKAEDYMNDRHREIINTEISAFEFTLIITDLLQELCKAESSLSGSQGSQISMQCINFSLRNLCSLQFGSGPTSKNVEASRIKVALTELLMVSLDKVLIHSDLCAKLINNGILPMLLRILEDTITKNGQKKDGPRADEETDRTEAENLVRFVFGVAYSVTAFLHCLLMQCRTLDKLREFTDQFRLYAECRRGGLLDDAVRLVIRAPAGREHGEAGALARKLVAALGRLIASMKRVRGEVVHTAACARARHKACRARVAAGLHHHHGALGEPGAGCCVAVLCAALAALLADERAAALPALRRRALRALAAAGVCCCFPPAALVEAAVRLALAHAAAAPPALRLLERTVYGERGAAAAPAAAPPRLPCAVCEPRPASFLVPYTSLLQLDNRAEVVHATVAHLVRVAPRCRPDVRYELVFGVVYPTFIVAKHRYEIRREEAARALTASCLDMFARLLGAPGFAEQFVRRGGLAYVLDLLPLPEFAARCCALLEIAITVEILQLERDNSEMSSYRDVSSLASVRMLLKTLADVTDECLKNYKSLLPVDEYDRLTDVTEERASLAFVSSMDPVERRASSPRPIESNFPPAENVEENSETLRLEVLKNVWTFWKSCASLCLYSPMFREYIVNESVVLDSYALLKLVLHYLCECECGAAETRALIKIMEAVLTVQLALAEATSGRSKEISCGVVSGALSGGRGSARLEGGARLRHVCEALVRVAAAEPGVRHDMPRHAHHKVVPLACASDGSSAEWSSSEESGSGSGSGGGSGSGAASAALLASDHSDVAHTPDDGYEADVEIGKFDLLPPFKSRKNSSNMSSIPALGIQAMIPESLNLESGDYVKNGELAHPELCVIVVDLLVQLVDKVMVGADDAEGGLRRAGAALAGACGARLAGARAPPPALLARLLQPPVRDLLANTDPHLHELRGRVVEAVVCLGAGGLRGAELGALLGAAARPAPRALLAALHALVPAHPHNPTHALAFPHHADTKCVFDEYVHVNSNGVSSQSHAAEATARKLQEAHIAAGIESAWSSCASHVGVSCGWSPWMQGFAVDMWLAAHDPQRTHAAETTDEINGDSSDCESNKPSNKTTNKSPNKPEQRPELMHVFSIGHDSLMFEIWLETQTGFLCLRLSRPESSSARVLSACRVTTRVAHARRWTCLAINVTEKLLKRAMHIQATVFVNGYELETVSLPVQGVMVRKAGAAQVLVGARGGGCGGGGGGGGAGGGYQLATLHVRRAPLYCAALAIHAAAHGPHSSCMVKCESPNFPSLLTPELLDADIDWDQVFELPPSRVRALHEATLLQFSAHAPTIINLYHHTASPVFGVEGGASIPEALFLRWASVPTPTVYHGFVPALHTLNGIDVLLYLYARVVELGAPAQEQALALRLVLRASSVDARLYAGYHAAAADMLLTVLGAPRAAVSPHLVQAVVEAACGGGGVVRAARAGAVTVSGARAALTEPAHLQLLARAAPALDNTQEFTWEVDGAEGKTVERGSAWALALCCMRELVAPGHVRRQFNVDQMNRAGIMQLLLTACKERYLYGSVGGGCVSAARSLVCVVRALLGSPPAPAPTAALADFLLLMHQASDTFVTHSRANFYFLVSAETAASSEVGAARRKHRARRRPRDVTPPAPAPPPPPPPADHIDSSQDSTKQIKGIINMHIKEGRKHNLSSTSEASDTTADAAENSEGEGARPLEESSREEGGEEGGDVEKVSGELNEYIVVEEDDVNHTTVEMYSSGIYHQSRVRAGAGSEWVAREGLLLLLRDALLLLPDHALQQLQQGGCGVWSVARAESVCALGNHRAGVVRAAVLRAAAALLRRAHPDLLRRLHHHHYYIHLANQISLYEGSWELATACAAFITECEVPLEDQLDEDLWNNVSPDNLCRSPPLLALLATCTHDIPLAHNVARLVGKLIDKASLKTLTELCCAEAVVKAVQRAGLLPEDEEGRELLLDDLAELLARLADKAHAAPHAAHAALDIHHLLAYVETAADAAPAARAARAVHAALFRAQLDALERRLQREPAPPATYFASVLAGAGAAPPEPGARLAQVAARAVAFLTQLPAGEPLPAGDARLLHRLLRCLPAAAPRARWPWSAGEWAPALAELAGWALARRGPDAPGVLRALYLAPPAALAPLAPDPPAARKLAVYLLMILKDVHAEAERGPPPLELAITDWARGWALALQAGLPDRLHSETLALEADAYARADAERRARAAARRRAALAKTVFARETLAQRVADSAMAATRVAVEAQNAERKRFMEHLRAADARAAAATLAWERLVDTHAHEQGVWHDPASYPQAWQLDPTEGPGRVRVRLRRAHLHIPAKFLKPEFRHKAEAARRAAPLASVVGGAAARRGGLVARLQLHETVAYMARATCVTVASETAGELLLSDRSVHFVPDAEGAGAASWPLDTLVQVVTRRWCLRELAVELFLSSGHAHLLAFHEPAERAAFLKALAAGPLPARVDADSLQDAMAAWRAGNITNWEYLMRLNGLAGRSYNDLMQYPVLPFVLADYTSRILDLGEPASFRDLARPMAVQNEARERHYVAVYNDLKAARREGCSPLLSRQPHHYASLYSNSGGVLHYLVRLPPFTELFLNYQDNNFDMPDRTFHSLATTWRLITNDSPTDVKELIPELFYLPELFHNTEGLNLGTRQCGAGIDSVELPPWAADARLFTLVHRQALESRAVTERLPHWIDLVFGYKQTGQAAVDAVNVFPACTYYGFDPESLEDEVDRTAAAAMVRTYGQAPRQLLRAPHPQPAADLLEVRDEPGVWAGVRGARWGRYCGSPALPPPAVAARRTLAGACAALPLGGARAAAAATRDTLLVPLADEAGAPRAALALLSWGHSDDVMRLKRRRDAPPEPLLHTPPQDRVTRVAGSCLGAGSPCPVVVGHASGRVLALRLRLRAGAVRLRARPLLAHAAPITALAVCPRAALVVSASEDGRIVLWDLNGLSYIRTLPNRDASAARHAAISPTLCDVATVHATGGAGAEPGYESAATHRFRSVVRVHTVNGVFVGVVKVPEEVTCVCYSGAAEGVSVNSVAAGLRTGGVRLYSAWDLRPTVVVAAAARGALLSLGYGADSQLLFGCYEGGVLVAWEAAAATRADPVRLHPAHSLC